LGKARRENREKRKRGGPQEGYAETKKKGKIEKKKEEKGDRGTQCKVITEITGPEEQSQPRTT